MTRSNCSLTLHLNQHQQLLVVCFTILLFLSDLVMPFTVEISDSNSSTVPSGSTPLIDGISTKQDNARTDPREQHAVYDIMKATGNDWATDIPDVCRGRWHGIECMPDKDNVYHIVSLSFGALSDDTAFPTCDPTSSTISPSILNLPHLKTLFFYRCFSHNPRPIPSFLGRLGPSLQTLVLRENGHIGPIPNALGNLTRLKVLDLHKNNLNGSIPVSLNRITGLKSLDLSVNKLTSSIPNLTFLNLNVLDLNQNRLSGPIPSTLWECHSLIKLDLSRNRLSGPIPDKLMGLKDLMLMDLSFNFIQGPFPKSLKSLSSLQALLLKGNLMGSTIVPNDGFDGMKDLTILVMSNTNLLGPIPESLGKLPNLRVLHLDGNHFNGSIPKSFRDLRSLSELRLNDNGLTGPVPFEREMVWKMRRKLRLDNNSGLCYEASSGLGDSVDSDLGIGLCESSSPGSVRTVQHVSDRENPTLMDDVSISSDATLTSSEEISTTGCCFRNAEGVFVVGHSTRKSAHISVLEGEVMALQEAIQVAIAKGWDKVVFETDSRTLVDRVSDWSSGISEFNAIVSSIKSMLALFFNFEVKFVRRQANMTAHTIARATCS